MNKPAPQLANKSNVTTLNQTGVLQRKCASCGNHTVAGGKCEECEKQGSQLQRKTASQGEPGEVPTIVYDVLNSPGHPLDAQTRAIFELRFGHDFSRVSVHTDAKAAESAQSVNALAYTVGNNVVFGAGQYAPETMAGQRLLAHELTHTVQQNGAMSKSMPVTLGATNDTSEKEASQAAQAISSGAASYQVQGNAAASVQRKMPGGDPLHQPMVDKFRREHGLPESGVDEFGTHVGPSTAEIKYGIPAKAGVLADELQKLINVATWKEIRKRAYPKESAPGIQRAKDRKAGKLPDLTGLGQIKVLEHFATQVRSIQTNWSSLATADNRVKELGKAASVELTSVNVPGFLIVDKQPMEFKGFFSPRGWKFVIQQELVSNTSLSNQDAAELSNTTLHECRHAEQHFLSARHSAGVNGKDSAALVAEQHIPKVIADEAVAKKFDASTDAATKALGKEMHKAMITEGADNQAISNDDGIDDLNTKRGEAEAALKNLQAVPTAKTIAEATAKRNALQAQIIIVEQKYTPYRNIPYEFDAHEVGDAAEQAFKEWK